MAIVQCRSRAQWPAKLKQLSLRSWDGDRESRMGGVDGRSTSLRPGIIIGSRSRVTGKATTSRKHNHLRRWANSFDFELFYH
jgi:hypothetical protein